MLPPQALPKLVEHFLPHALLRIPRVQNLVSSPSSIASWTLSPASALASPAKLVLDLLSRDQLARAGFYVRDGFEAARQIREFAPDTKIIILSM